MIKVILNGVVPYEVDFSPGLTAGGLLQKFKDEKKWRFNGNPVLHDTTQNTVISSETPISDERTYYLSAWIVERPQE